jgi:hypothetical protein
MQSTLFTGWLHGVLENTIRDVNESGPFIMPDSV